MTKMMVFRFDPAMDTIIEEIADDLGSREARHISKKEVVERAVATLHSLLVSGNFSMLQTSDIQPTYHQSLAQVRGLSTEEG